MLVDKSSLPILSFEIAHDFRCWLQGNHETCSAGIWLKIYKKDSGVATVSYQEALEEALCFGWIDGQKKSFDRLSWIQKFTPRRARSMWSKRNRDIVAGLIVSEKMTAFGYAEIEKAKADGRWAAAYDSPKNMAVPEDFMELLRKNKSAYDFFQTLNKSKLYAIAFRLQTAKKPETTQRRMRLILEMLENGKFL